MHLNKQKVLILSGGLSSRFGSPKALAIYNGETFLDTIVSKCLSLNLETYVVLNSHLNDIIEVKRNYTTIIGDSSKDMYDSISKGVIQIGEFSQLIIWPVDHPAVALETLKKILENKHSDNFIVPSYSKRLGHPVVFPFSAKSHLENCKNLKELIELVGRVIVEVNDKGIHQNINKRENLP